MTSLRTLAAGLLLLSVSCDGEESAALKAARAFGFTPLLPPSNLAPPGTVVFELQKPTGDQAAQYSVICPATDVLLQPAEISPSATYALNKQASGSFKIDVKALKQLSAGAEFDHVRSVQLTMKKVVVYELPDTYVKVAPDPCKQAIRRRQAEGRVVTLVKGVIKADVDYVVTVDDSGKTQLEVIMPQIAASLGGQWGDRTTTTVTGESLTWGVYDDTSLVKTALGEVAAVREPSVRTFQVEGIARIVPAPGS